MTIKHILGCTKAVTQPHMGPSIPQRVTVLDETRTSANVNENDESVHYVNFS